MTAQPSAYLDFDDHTPIFESKLDALERVWNEKRQSRDLPFRASFSMRDLKPWINHLALVEAYGNPMRFRVNLMGMACVRIAGDDYTGQWLDNCVQHRCRDQLLAAYQNCLDRSRPTRNVVTYVRDGVRKTDIHRIYLPCFNNQSERKVVMVAAYALEERGRFYDLEAQLARTTEERQALTAKEEAVVFLV